MTYTSLPTTPSRMLPNGSIDIRMIAAIRFVLACSALVIIYIDPTQPAIFSALTYSSLVIYTIWSFILAIMSFRRDPTAPPPRDAHWGDVLFCAYLVTLTHGTNSLFFTYFLFAILSASFSRGTQEGLLITGAAVVLFILASIWFEPDASFGFDQSLVRPLYLVSLGYMISYWGGHEISQRRRMWLLQELNSLIDQRLGYAHAIRANLEKILNFFEAKACILIINRPGATSQYLSFYITERNLSSSTPAHKNEQQENIIPDYAAKVMLDLPEDFAGFHTHKHPWWHRLIHKREKMDEAISEKMLFLEDILDATGLLTAPYHQQDGSSGRFFLVPNKQALTQSDIPFIKQLLSSISHFAENILLMDELVASTAKHERFKISLDIHDTTIQPYIGLKLGLDALNRKAGNNNALSTEISELLSMTEATIQDLRKYVSTLRDNKHQAADTLLKSLHELADRFKRYYGITVQVNCNPQLTVNPNLAEAASRICAEGLSNILKHTKAKNAYLSIRADHHSLHLEIGNENPPESASSSEFTPVSIHSRAVSLGGSSFVDRDTKGYTVVNINLPL